MVVLWSQYLNRDFGGIIVFLGRQGRMRYSNSVNERGVSRKVKASPCAVAEANGGNFRVL